ncbi:MAG: hypothetical protein KDB60_06665, partial [Propionibacteriaceae bacterium]|nr:hypothetical protein [Propionibacteriaceae bacterium]
MPPELKIFGALIGLVASGAIALQTATPAQAATGRASDSAGSATVGTAAYSAPSNAIYVSKSGSDSNPGSLAAPVGTLTKALTLAG